MNDPQTLHKAAKLTCVLPGLIWPAPGVAQLLRGQALPGLSALLGRGTSAQQPGQPWLQWLGAQFQSPNPPWASIRLAGEASPPPPLRADHTWLCADPVSLRFAREALLLAGPGSLQLHTEEAHALAEALNSALPETGLFHVATPERWYLQTPAPTGARFMPLADVEGRPAALFQPEGPRAGHWARMANEAQIVLHNHPANRTREERGQPMANALWLWGDGEPGKLVPPCDTLVASDPALLGLGALSHTPTLTPAAAARPDHGRTGHTWWADTRLLNASLAGDHAAWASALIELDAQLIEPLWRAWQAGKLAQLTLVAPCDKVCLMVSATRWRFWRRPLPHAALCSLLETPNPSSSQ